MANQEFTRMVWQHDMTFEGKTTTGHSIVIDAVPPAGSDNGPKPVELLLTALAGCTAMDVLSILQKKREPLQGLEVYVAGTRADEHPRVYRDIEVVYRVRGNVSPEAVAHAIELSETKYCGVSAMLRPTANITTRYEIEPAIEATPTPTTGSTGRIDEPEHVSELLP